MNVLKNCKIMFIGFFLFAMFSVNNLTYGSNLAREIGDQMEAIASKRQYIPNIVKWEGTIQCSNSSHLQNLGCNLEFIRSSDGKAFKILENKQLIKRHCQHHKNLKAVLKAELTSSFLFWGGNLIVKDYKILKELENKKKTVRIIRNIYHSNFEKDFNRDF